MCCVRIPVYGSPKGTSEALFTIFLDTAKAGPYSGGCQNTFCHFVNQNVFDDVDCKAKLKAGARTVKIKKNHLYSDNSLKLK